MRRKAIGAFLMRKEVLVGDVLAAVGIEQLCPARRQHLYEALAVEGVHHLHVLDMVLKRLIGVDHRRQFGEEHRVLHLLGIVWRRGRRRHRRQHLVDVLHPHGVEHSPSGFAHGGRVLGRGRDRHHDLKGFLGERELLGSRKPLYHGLALRCDAPVSAPFGIDDPKRLP